MCFVGTRHDVLALLSDSWIALAWNVPKSIDSQRDSSDAAQQSVDAAFNSASIESDDCFSDDEGTTA
jgi:hypothetical protein